MNLISVLFVIISIGSITSYGLSEGRNTFYKTISFSSKPFNLTNGDKVSYLLLNVLFFTGLILLVVSALNYCKNNKRVASRLLFIFTLLYSTLFLFHQSSIPFPESARLTQKVSADEFVLRVLSLLSSFPLMNFPCSQFQL